MPNKFKCNPSVFKDENYENYRTIKIKIFALNGLAFSLFEEK